MNTLIDLIGGAAGWQQTDRLMRFATSQPGLIPETARIDEALGPVAEHAGFRIELTVLSANAHQPLAALLGQPARLDLQTSFSRTTLRPFHGHITHLERLGANGGFARYRLVIEPWLAFLGHRQDNYLFQDKSVIEIVDELLGDWKGQGKLAPDWRWDLADQRVYPKRGMTTQYQETDLAFLNRLLAEEGLFCWFEHTAEEGDTLGSHRLVIADYNAAFKANPQARIRYTQAGATLAGDALDRWHSQHRVDTAESNSHSRDYRSLATRPQTASSAFQNAAQPKTVAWHDPGQYAWQTSAHGERMLTRQRQAIDARLQQYHAAGTVRTAAPGSTFHLADHPEHPLGQGEADEFLITAVTHHARNNLDESIPAVIEALGPVDNGQPDDAPTDFYRNRISAVRASTSWRPLVADRHGHHIHPRPTARGSLTGIVVAQGDCLRGDGSPTHTDRDGRIRVQLPWQRGSQSASRSPHPSGADNAPASAALGVWLRVMSPVAGANWGTHFTPRPGQEVIIAFQNGNIDRPVIVGTAYNGQGNRDAQDNRIGGGTMQASANAPAFFAGDQAAAHTHGASLSGLKSQQLGHSRDGRGGYNQLVFDDTPGESRIELATTEHQSQLQLGHLKQQSDNARLANRGHGGELATRASAALRAGSGLLLSADTRPNASGSQLDSREAIAQTEAAHSLGQSLAELAVKQNAAQKGDPQATQLPAIAALDLARQVLSATASHGQQAAASGDIKSTQGGTGTVPAWSQPNLQYSAPGGIAQLTPTHHILVAGKNASIISGQDTQLISQGNHSLAVKEGLSIFSHGKSKDPHKPNQETGIHLHAASGKVSTQAQSGKFTAAADRKVTLASTQGSLTASAKGHFLATAQGAYMKLEGGNIQLHAPGPVQFKASKKVLAGPKCVAVALPNLPAPADLSLPQDGPHSLRFAATGMDAMLGDGAYSSLPYALYDQSGNVLQQGTIADDGRLPRIKTDAPEKIVLEIGKADTAQFESLPPNKPDPAPAEPEQQVEQGIEDELEAAPERKSKQTSRYLAALESQADSQHQDFLSESFISSILKNS